MMKKLACLAVCVLSAIGISACSSFEIGANTNDVKFTTDSNVETLGHVNADIWGVYVFGLPVISGSSVEPGKCVVFSDTVDTSNAISFLTRNARKKLNATTITDVQSERTTGWLVPTLFFFYRDIQVSGNVVK
jgi:hypothetical protein